MARKLQMTWVPSRKGWLVHYGRKMYSVSCKQLGVDPTKEASWRAANEWWARKKAEVDAGAMTAGEDDPNAAYRSAVATLAAIREFERSGDVPPEIGVDLGDARGLVTFSLESARKEGEAIAARAIAALDSALRKADPGRTLGGRSDAWYETLRASVDAGRIDVSRFGAYRRNLSTFVQWAGPGTSVEGLTAAKLADFYQELSRRVASKQYSPDYARSILGATRQFVAWLAEMDIIPAPGNLRSKKFRFGKGKRVSKADLFEVDEVRRLLGAAGERLRLFLLLMLNAGMYQSDISDLGEDEVDWEARTIRRSRSKTDAVVVTYRIWPETHELLEKYRNLGAPVPNERGSARVLVTGDGKPLTAYRIEGGKERRYDTVNGLYSRLKTLTGIRKPLKGLRKTSASLLATHPQYKFYAQYFLGHSPATVADERYVVPNDEEFFAALDWLRERILGKGREEAS